MTTRMYVQIRIENLEHRIITHIAFGRYEQADAIRELASDLGITFDENHINQEVARYRAFVNEE